MSLRMADKQPDAQTVDSGKAVLSAPLLVGLLFLVAAISLILARYDRGRGSGDQNTFHLPAIREFAREWPHLDFRDYNSATTPGYHIVVAGAAHWLSPDLRLLQFVGSLFTLGLLLTVAAAAARKAHSARAVLLLCLPMVCSLYVLSSGVWLAPDNSGWWGMVGVLLIALRGRVDAWTYVGGGILLLALILVHQSGVWTLAPLCLAAWLGDDAPEGARGSSANRISLMLAACTPALAALAYFTWLWHGLTPPNQRHFVAGINPAGPAAALAIAGALGLFFVPILLDGVKGKPWRGMACLGACAGFVIGAIPPTSYNLPAGRVSGIWNAVPHLPIVANRSPLIVGLSALGGAIIAVWLLAMPKRDRAIWGCSVIAFGATLAATQNAFQRYSEPLVVIVAPLTLAAIASKAPRWTWLGPMLLSLLLASVTVMSLK